jgi:hypothetical protein
MPAVAGMLLVAIQNGNIQAQIQRQRFVPLQTAVDFVEAIPQLADVHGGVHSSHGIGADQGPSQPTFPESGGGKGIQRIETSQTRPAHRQRGLQNLRGKRSRLLTRVGDFVEYLAGKVKHLLGIANEAVQ